LVHCLVGIHVVKLVQQVLPFALGFVVIFFVIVFFDNFSKEDVAVVTELAGAKAGAAGALGRVIGREGRRG
jgi:hypothetical protein